MNIDNTACELNDYLEEQCIYEAVEVFDGVIHIELAEFINIESIMVDKNGSVTTKTLVRNDELCSHVGHDYIAPTLFDDKTDDVGIFVNDLQSLISLIESEV